MEPMAAAEEETGCSNRPCLTGKGGRMTGVPGLYAYSVGGLEMLLGQATDSSLHMGLTRCYFMCRVAQALCSVGSLGATPKGSATQHLASADSLPHTA